MTFESARGPWAEPFGLAPDVTRSALSSEDMPLTPRLAALGPVLLVSDAGRATAGPWRVGVTIDGDGVREWIDLGPCRLFRLPDSDYHAWERLADVHGAPPGAPPRQARAATLRRAVVVAAHAHQWQSVARLSLWGWERARQIACLERAALDFCILPTLSGRARR